MRADLFLVAKGLCSSRQEAKEAIDRGAVLVGGAAITKASKDIKNTDEIELLWSRPYVSRGGEKLEGVFLDYFKDTKEINPFLKGKDALDVGSSTGGFSDFLLQHGIGSVTCVDVGTSQLHEKVFTQENVTVYENTDIRNFSPQGLYDVVVGDVSFISLEKILEKIISFGKSGSFFALLIKPQFEVGKGNTKKGIVKDAVLVEEILSRYSALVDAAKCRDIHIYPSTVIGGDGNQEYFLVFTR